MPFYAEKYRKCRMCLKALEDDDKSLFDDDKILLIKFQKAFNAKFVYSFEYDNMKHLACLCKSCVERIHDYYKLSHVARKNIKRFLEDKNCLRYRCLMCLKGLNLLDLEDPTISIFKDNDFKLAKIYGKCFRIREVHHLLEVRDSDRLCQKCYYKLLELNAMRINVNALDADYFGSPYNEK